MERTLGWLMRNRRLSKDYERMVQSSESFIEVAMIRLILRRLARRVATLPSSPLADSRIVLSSSRDQAGLRFHAPISNGQRK